LRDDAVKLKRLPAGDKNMTAPKKTPFKQSSPYKIAAAARRAKVASTAAPDVSDAKPSMGRIRVVLSGKALSRAGQVLSSAGSSINIPEFSITRTKKD
jgi:hypothetical protein